MSTTETTYTRADLTSGLNSLGLGRGDVALVRVALKALGPVDAPAADGERSRPSQRVASALIEALLNVVGQEGTIVGLAHTATGRRSETQTVFRPDSRAVTGGFVAAMLEWDGAVRSSHPTNSMVAIGPEAASLLDGHDETSTCFGAMRRLIDADAKMVLIGCIDASPGFSTLHLVYEDLGLAQRSLLTGLEGSYYERNGELHWFARRDVPGCSMGFGRLYALYRARGVLSEGKVGDAESMLIGSRDAYAIEREAVRKDPTISLCDDPDCISCRGTKLFNLRDMPRFYVSRPRMLAGLLRAQAQRLVTRRG